MKKLICRFCFSVATLLLAIFLFSCAQPGTGGTISATRDLSTKALTSAEPSREISEGTGETDDQVAPPPTDFTGTVLVPHLNPTLEQLYEVSPYSQFLPLDIPADLKLINSVLMGTNGELAPGDDGRFRLSMIFKNDAETVTFQLTAQNASANDGTPLINAHDLSESLVEENTKGTKTGHRVTGFRLIEDNAIINYQFVSSKPDLLEPRTIYESVTSAIMFQK